MALAVAAIDGPVVWESSDPSASLVASGRPAVARSLGLPLEPGPEDLSLLPLRLHERLLNLPVGTAVSQVATDRFTAAGYEFWWLGPAGDHSELDAMVGLAGHTIGWPTEDVHAGIASALALLATRPWAMTLVGTYITTFGCATAATPADESRQITSCSLPDFPLCVFMSPRVFRHIPPVGISDGWEVRAAAENIYHEAVHQFMNQQLLTSEILRPDYSSETSPKIPIFWRSSATDERNREWELDRVLHATAVYCHLLRWRYHELADGALSADYRRLVAQTSQDAIGAVDSLCGALTDHVQYFAPNGKLLVERMIAAAQRWMPQLAALTTSFVR